MARGAAVAEALLCSASSGWEGVIRRHLRVELAELQWLARGQATEAREEAELLGLRGAVVVPVLARRRQG